jgi:DNA ligase-1
MTYALKLMLAGKVQDIEQLRYPVLGSPKLDGIRATVFDNFLYSRKMKRIPNINVQKMFGLRVLEFADGELIVGSPTAPDAFNQTSSVIMSDDVKHPEIKFYVFDRIPMERPMGFHDRLRDLQRRLEGTRPYEHGRVVVVPHQLISNADELRAAEEGWLEAGYEGAMIRSLDGPYKHGRSTWREGHLLKLKRFQDSEAKVLGFVEQMHNENEQTRDVLGRSKRSSHKAGKRGAGVLGALVVRDRKTGVEFEIGTGFDAAQRRDIWMARDAHLGLWVKYKFFPGGVKNKPRFPVFVGFRDKRDM